MAWQPSPVLSPQHMPTCIQSLSLSRTHTRSSLALHVQLGGAVELLPGRWADLGVNPSAPVARWPNYKSRSLCASGGAVRRWWG